MTSVYYNEWEPYPAQWLRNLIKAGHLPAGDVDERDIRDIKSDDLKGYDQCHFFAGIGGWLFALKLAGWKGPIWTGSCPCQPLSSAGQHKGHADERHLWPAFQSLIAECKPPTVAGEQVASKDGREWLAGIRADLEDLGYAIGAADLPAACVKAKHNRPRLFYVANSSHLFSDCGTNDISCGQSRSRPVSQFGNSDRQTIRQSGDWELGQPPFPMLAYEIPGLLGATSAYGNAIVPQVAAEFMIAYMEART